MAPLTATPADLITYQRELVRTRNYLPLGRINKIAIAPSKSWVPLPNDPVIARWGRFMDLRSQWLPLAKSREGSLLVVPAPMMDRRGNIGLPDVPDPSWRPRPWTDEEISGKVHRPMEEDMARMVPQRLEDRAERGANGGLGKLEGSNFLVFQPVISILFQPERDAQLQAQMWEIQAGHDSVTRTDMALLVDPQTGETLFFGGRWDISANEG